ncbi:hypothetical protein SAMN05421810_104376 [Amycolatopsis arida]|uniref:PPE family protein n=1 Tax=Amycolatopsis arida TaxID=587909 RepID=A0A1I5VHL9_9PSEU|nr:PE-PGRS family protein [Amycolatopsis arida]TDX87889.1 hypothetical protein CLV69_11221 [Amycolatopsis arida]SFQ06990.1 hypothetical protein SAMN05421810_104376 [Amycolatopsis arida]
MDQRGVPEPDRRYEAYSHPAMRAEVETGNDPAEAGDVGQQWGELAARLRESTDALRGVAEASAELWRGGAGDAVRHALTAAAGWADEAARVSDAVGGSVAEQAAVAARARAEMPEPVDYDPAGMIRGAAGSGDIVALIGLSDALAGRRLAAEVARQRAIDVMRARDAGLRAAVPAVGFPDPPPLTARGGG